MTVSRLGVIGDVHAEDRRLEDALRFLTDEQVDAVICTGDVMDGTGCPDRSASLLKESGAHTVRGNHDRWVIEEKARHIPNAHHRANLESATLNFLDSLPTQIVIKTVAGSLLLCHGIADNDLKKVWPGTERMGIERCHRLDALIESRSHQYVVNGHMHFRTLMHFDSLTLINAGTLQGEHWPGFSIIDFELQTITAFQFQSEGIVESVTLSLLPASHHIVWDNTQCFTGDWTPVRLFH